MIRNLRAPRALICLGVASCVFMLAGCSTAPRKVDAATPLLLVRKEAQESRVDAIYELARRIRADELSIQEQTSVIDDALEHRHAESVHFCMAWGEIIDSYLASTPSDEFRVARCYAEIVAVSWWGNSEVPIKPDGSLEDPSFSLTFQPAVGFRSPINYAATIESASIDTDPLETRVLIDRPSTYGIITRDMSATFMIPHHASSTVMSISLPSHVAGKRLTIRWRVQIKHDKTGESLAPDWVHTEIIDIPSTGSGHYSGSRRRTITPDFLTGKASS